jgi:dihydroorotate dehydrogenase (fumarate)
MKNLETTYLGLKLTSPVIAASSPFTSNVERIEKLADAGIGAVVLKSIFEEQIAGETASMERYSDYPEAADYLSRYVGADYIGGFINMIEEAKKQVSIPIIASINCISDGAWIDYAQTIEQAGADAVELNIFIQPHTTDLTGADVEALYGRIVENVVSRVSIPVSVKLASRFTNVFNVATALYDRGARGFVLFNRLFEPDIDIDQMEVVASSALSATSELRGSIRSVEFGAALMPQVDFAVSTGVLTGDDVVKCLLAGARATQICTALYNGGSQVVGEMNSRIATWMEKHGYDTIEQFRGLMNARLATNSDAYGRVQYMRFFPIEI